MSLKTAAAERRRRVLLPRHDRDEPEGQRHQDVPLPPRGVPVAAEGDRDHRFRKEREGNEDRERHRGRAPPEQPEVSNRCKCVERERHGGQAVKRAVRLFWRERTVEWVQVRQRIDAPGGQESENDPAQEPLAAHHRRRGTRREVERRGRGEHARDHQADRSCDHEAGVLVLEEDARCGQCVERQEPGAGHECERDQEESRVAELSGRLSGQIGEHHAEQRGDEDEPKVSGMVLPVGIEPRTAEQQQQPRHRERERDEPASHGHGRA